MPMNKGDVKIRNLSKLAMHCYPKILAIPCIPEILKDKNKRP